MKPFIIGILPCLMLHACAGKKSDPSTAEVTAIEKTGIKFQIDSADAPSAVLSSITDSAALAHVIGYIQTESQSGKLSESALKQYETVTMALEKPSEKYWAEVSTAQTNIGVLNNIRNKLFEYKGAAYYNTEEPAERVTPFVNEPLPLVYVQRSYLHNPAALGYDIYRLPGRFVEKNEDGAYELVTILSTLKSVPPQTILTNEVLYSNKINDGASFNGKALIGGISVEKERMMELIIQDVAKTIVPSDSIINSTELKKKINSIPKERKKNIYFIEGAVLTVVNYRKFNKSKFKAGVNTNWVTAEGQTFNSDESFKKERLVSLDLVKVDKILP